MKSGTGIGFGCGCLIAVLAINLAIGGFCVDYDLYSLWGVDLPWWADCLIGLVAGEVAVPAAIVILIVRACGVPVPFWPMHH